MNEKTVRKIKWRVCKWTHPMKLAEVGFVFAIHHFDAKRLAYARWPNLKPTKAYPHGRAQVDPVRKTTRSRPMSKNNMETSRALLEVFGVLLKGVPRG